MDKAAFQIYIVKAEGVNTNETQRRAYEQNKSKTGGYIGFPGQDL